ncbi:RidA family protein [Kiloniella sp.]|uniref:RidA family protein n=1 Tax=Kiloniella sp. TaxID=1938587 RepID=UPI003B022BB7
MTTTIEARLKTLAIDLPEATAPVANYVPYVCTGNLVFVSGQLPMANGEIICKGQVGTDVSIEEAQAAARQCVLNLIAQVKSACDGDLEKIKRVVRLGGFVNSAAGFTDHALVINGASDLMCEIFGDKGKHARAAVGSSSLPFGVSVEVDAIFELED